MSARRPAPTTVLGLVLLLAAGSAGATTTTAPAAAWPQHRGPEQSGAVDAPGVFAAPEFGLAVAWKAPLGSGYSGIAVADGVAVTMTSDGTDDVVVAFDAASGAERWRWRIAETYRGHTGSDDGPISTPTVADGTVYGLGPRGQLFALRLADGGEVWTRELAGHETSRPPFYGYSTSPVVVGDALVVLTGGADGHTIETFARADGAPRWSWGDDTVSYQTPILATIGGREQLVAASNHLLVGLDPATGEVLWEHRHTPENGDGFAQPVALGEGRFLLNHWQEAVAYGVTPEGDGYAVAELWRTPQLRNSYGIPVVHDGHLFGWSGRFLAGLDAASGEVAWKSRPPGGRNQIVVDGHLVIVDEEGQVVVVEASPDEYRERVRIAALDGPTHTAASFAGDRLYVRDLSHLVALDVTERRAAAAAPPAPEPLDLPAVFATFVAAVEAAAPAARGALVDAWMAAHPTLPVVGDDGHAVFVYRGEVADIALAGNVHGFTGAETPLRRLADTDLHYTALRLDPRSHYEYRFNVDFGNLVADPRNPHQVGSIFGPSSELRMPGWTPPDHLGEPTGERGRMETFTLTSEVMAGDREVYVYLPAAYDADEAASFPLLVVYHGTLARQQKLYDRALDNLIAAGRVRPLVAVFLDRVNFPEYSVQAGDTARFLTTEVLPELARRYRLSEAPADRAITGVGSGAYAAAYTAFATPGSFGGLATQSFYLPGESDLMERIAAAKAGPMTVYVETSDHDYLTPPQLDARADSLALAEALGAAGHAVTRNDTHGSAGAGHWRAQDDDILELLFPAAD